MKFSSIYRMYRDLIGTLRLKNGLFAVLVIKLILLWAMFHYLYENPYTISPESATAAIAEKLKPQ